MSSLSNQQFPTHMTAQELSQLRLGDTRKGESNADVMARKLKSVHEDNWTESKGLYKSIQQHGVKEPVTIVTGTHHKTGAPIHDLHEGHHRVAAALDINPAMKIPVKYTDVKDLTW